MCSRANNFRRFLTLAATGCVALSFACGAANADSCTAPNNANNAHATNPSGNPQSGTPPAANDGSVGSAAPVGCPVTKTFGGLTLGVGLGLSMNASKSRVTSATLTSTNIVRVTATADASAEIVLESHYFFVPNRAFFTVPAGDWGTGPFVAIVAGTTGTDVINAYALGWMIGFREPTWNLDSNKNWQATYGTASWNFGVGLRVDPNAQTLGDGIVANAPLPAGETSIRYKTAPSYGVMLLSSFSF
jgi:hypothetical protein